MKFKFGSFVKINKKDNFHDGAYGNVYNHLGSGVVGKDINGKDLYRERYEVYVLLTKTVSKKIIVDETEMELVDIAKEIENYYGMISTPLADVDPNKLS